MPVVNATVKAALEAKLTAIFTVEDSDKLSDFCQAIADLITTDVIPNMTVTTTVAVASVSGVTTGAGVSGPGTGTGTGGVS